ncbi:MAG TPA: hypothetical protein VG055_00260 [Planctomycetaceae bacterium]|jgi:hypothetical protein|nr:hypothetical protein [Planctomycetaceae bacterium]
MPATVSLAKLVSALQFVYPGAALWIDIETGDVVEQAEALGGKAGSADPTRYRTVGVEVDEFEVAKRFCETVAEPSNRRRLETALSSAQPLESFENALFRLGIAHKWFPFREIQLGNLAKAWLAAQGIPFLDDLS